MIVYISAIATAPRAPLARFADPRSKIQGSRDPSSKIQRPTHCVHTLGASECFPWRIKSQYQISVSNLSTKSQYQISVPNLSTKSQYQISVPNLSTKPQYQISVIPLRCFASFFDFCYYCGETRTGVWYQNQRPLVLTSSLDAIV
jgi:hypothetical protein